MQGFHANGQHFFVLRPIFRPILNQDAIRRRCFQPGHHAHRFRHSVDRGRFFRQRANHKAGTVFQVPIFPDHLSKRNRHFRCTECYNSRSNYIHIF